MGHGSDQVMCPHGVAMWLHSGRHCGYMVTNILTNMMTNILPIVGVPCRPTYLV